jgi:YD repeat-containing protein
MKKIIYLVIVFASFLSYSQNIVVNSADVLDGSEIAVGATLTVQDPLFNSASTNYYTDINPNCKIYFGFDENKFFKDKFSKVYSCAVQLEIFKNGSATPQETLDFEVFHNNSLNDIKLNDLLIRKFVDLKKLSISVKQVVYKDISGNPITLTNAENSTYIKLDFETERYFNISNTKLTLSEQLVTYSGVNQTFNTSSGQADLANEVRINWSETGNPATEYELEWTWVDNYNQNLSTVLSKNQIPLTESDFSQNSTRIHTKNKFYQIPLIYNKGYLVYRVRPVGRFLNKVSKNYYGNWTTIFPENYTTVANWPNVLEINEAHEKGSKNWQYQVSFAEEGKKKDVISYFDGSLRNRQTVTKINTNNQTVVGEVVYDNQGRAAIEILPTPIQSGEIKYFKNLNQNLNQKPYTHLDFDWDNKSTTNCIPEVIKGMSTTSGASNYYSEFNLKQDGMQKFVPNANKFPFSQIEYTPDNTGRIRRKGGVGENHQIGKGHEMNYFYSTPSQEELNRLFGYKVGYAKRYKKNIVVDPNGQVSVSYLDPQGRTIATALTGKPSSPDSNFTILEDMSGAPALSVNVLKNNNSSASGINGVLNDQINFATTVEVAKTQAINLNYDLKLTNSAFTAACINKNYPFVFDGSIIFKNDCGNDILVGGNKNFTVGTYSLSNPAIASPLSFNDYNTLQTISIPTGTYNLSKKLKINQTALNNYADDYINTVFAKNSLCKPAGFNFGTSFSTSDDCEITCESCEKDLISSYLNSTDLAEFDGTFGNEENSLGNIVGRQQFITIAKPKYVKQLAQFVFPNVDEVQFHIIGNVVVPNVSVPDPELVQQVDFTLIQLNAEFDEILKNCRDLCEQPVSVCESNFELLIADVSPSGQYGEVEDQNEEVSIAENNTPDNTPVTNPEANANSFAKLSIFNDQNELSYASGEAIIDIPNNVIPTVETPKIFSKASWRFPRGNYKDISGNDSKIEVRKIDKETFEPQILAGYEYLVGDPINGKYYIKPQYLADVSDFLKNWDDNWAKSLIYLHPEYYYYKYFNALCGMTFYNFNTDTFDEDLKRDDLTLDDLIPVLQNAPTFNAEFTHKKARIIQLYTSFGDFKTSVSNSIDPYYHQIPDTVDPYYPEISDNTYYPEIPNKIEDTELYALRLSLLKEAMLTNYDGLKIGATQLNMITGALYFAKFSNGLVPQSQIEDFLLATTYTPGSNVLNYLNTIFAYIDNPNTGLTHLQKIRFLQNFTNNYVGFKTKTKTVFSNIYANQFKGNNDCIGNQEATETYRNIFRKQTLNFNSVNTAIHISISQGNQSYEPWPWTSTVCTNENSYLYKDKKKRFIAADTGFNLGLPDNVMAANANSDANSNYYLQTGNCPLILDMQNLLNGIIGNLDGISLRRSLYTPNNNTDIALSGLSHLSSKLYRAINPDAFDAEGNYLNTVDQFITSDTDGNDLTITVGSGTPITLTIEDPDNNKNPCNPDLSPKANWANYKNGLYVIDEIKNLTYVAGSYNPTENTYQFKAIAVVKRIPLCIIPEEIIILGKTTAPIGECQFNTPGSEMGVNNQSVAGAGCATKSKFENALTKLLEDLKKQNFWFKTTPITLNDAKYSYNNSIITELFNDDLNTGTWTNISASNYEFALNTTNGQSFTLNIAQNINWSDSSTSPISNNNAFNTSYYQITGIQISDIINEGNTLNLKMYLVDSSGNSYYVNGVISYIDFGCVCRERVYKPNHHTEVVFQNLINHIWDIKKDGYLYLNETQHINCNSNIYNPVCEIVQGCTNNGIHSFITKKKVKIPCNSKLECYNWVYGISFAFDKSTENCKFNLELLTLDAHENAGSGTTLLENIYKFSDFKITNNLGAGIYEFEIKVHHNAYTISTFSSIGTFPAGSFVKTGTISCLNLDCRKLSGLQESLASILNDVIDNDTIQDGYDVPSTLAEYTTNLPVTTNSGIKNFYRTQTDASSQIGFNFVANPTCEVKFTIPNTPLNQITGISNIVFNKTLTEYTADVTTLNGVIQATGVTTCLEIDECFEHAIVPCKTCIPKQPEPISCNAKWEYFYNVISKDQQLLKVNFPEISFTHSIHCPNTNTDDSVITGGVSPDELFHSNELQRAQTYFCQANYGYISDAYLTYLSYFPLNPVGGNISPMFLTIAEFGLTELRYGYDKHTQAVDDYYNYVQNTKAEKKPVLLWQEYINTIYVVKNEVCPPAPLSPTINSIGVQLFEPCDVFAQNVANTYMAEFLEAQKEKLREEFKRNYLSKAIEIVKETFTKSASDEEFQYTLYYYDQSGNLIQTVPPQGVNRLTSAAPLNIEIDKVRDDLTLVESTNETINSIVVAPSHKMETKYKYNSLNQLVWQSTPDGGETRFAYDGLGRIIASQNAKQKDLSGTTTNYFSYTRYDKLGRIFEAGQFEGGTKPLKIDDNGRLVITATNFEADVLAVENNYPYNLATRTIEVTKTKYDLPFNGSQNYFTEYSDDNCFKRVTGILYFDIYNTTTNEANYNNALFYDYDVHGNVKELVFENKDNNLRSLQPLQPLLHSVKKVAYDYDLISGNVNTVTFQPNVTDEQFIHKYKYDADNRIVEVQTSRDKVIWEKDAKYNYYEHGPLAQTIIGDKNVQGIDYIYTIQGWLKGTNSEKVGADFDAGINGHVRDGDTNYIAQDAFGFALNYFKGDYNSIGSVANTALDNKTFSYTQGLNDSGTTNNLYNGNIKEMVTALIDQNQNFIDTQFNSYKYDQLNRISSMTSKAFENNISNPNISSKKSIKSNYTYDKNGNLKTLYREAFNAIGAPTTTPMDDLTYVYPNALNNKLGYVKDQVSDAVFNQDLNSQSVDNYKYDAIGQLTRDESEKLTISWRVDGKVKEVLNDNGKSIKFHYDGLGNRISKEQYFGGNINKTYYFRDAQGNPLSVYEFDKPRRLEGTLYLSENQIYGSSRIGVENVNKALGTQQMISIPLKSSDAKNTDAIAERTVLVPAPPPVIVTTGGLEINSPGQYASWENNYSILNINPNMGALNEEIIINSNFKLDPTITSGKLFNLETNKYIESGRTSKLFKSIVLVNFEKRADNKYYPTIHLIKTNDQRYKRRKIRFGPRFFYTRYHITTIYKFKDVEGLSENEMNFSLKLKLNKATNSYEPELIVNGNKYKGSGDFIEQTYPEYVSGSANSFDFIFGKNTIGHLKSNICDFSYSIDKFMKDENDPKREHIFTFDNSNPTEALRVENYSTTYDLQMALEAGAIVNKLAKSYCGTGLLDSDGDGINDFDENGFKLDKCPYVFNPNQLDTDNDGFGDACDNCKVTPNGSAEHLDATTGLQLDVDGDGFGDTCDICKTTYNPEAFVDYNYDGFFDQLDSDVGGPDGIPNGCDNCPTVANPNQSDINQNGIGDLCEGLDQGQGIVISNPAETGNYYRYVGDKNYELSNHLGNVLSVVTDRLLFDYNGVYAGKYRVLPDVISYNDYYPFGMLVPLRTGNSPAYRYGFNTQEKVDEIKGEGNHNTAKFWEYDTRTGRRWNQDPKPNPSISNYSAFANNPILHNDVLGDTLKVGNTKESSKDIKSLTNRTNKKYIKINTDGNVTLDFSEINKNKTPADLFKEDEGLSLINDLIRSDKSFLYEATPLILIRDQTGAKVNGFTFLMRLSIVNASNYGQDSTGGHNHRPRDGFDGQVIISPNATFEETDASGALITKPRATLIFHELAENYERTHNNVNYIGTNGAHELAKKRELKWDKKSNTPGELAILPYERKPSNKVIRELLILSNLYRNTK